MAFTLAQEAPRKAAEEDQEPRLAKGGPQSPALHPNFPDGPAGLELALRMLANGTLTPEGFFAAFPHVDLANAIYAANTGQLTPATVEWLWRENLYSQAALQQKQDDITALRKALIDLQARDITEQDLLEMFPHLPLDQALALVNNPEGLYNLWMTEVGRAWVQDVEDRRNRERGWEATAQRYQGLAEHYQAQEALAGSNSIWPNDLIDFLRKLPVGANLPLGEPIYIPAITTGLFEFGWYGELSATPFGDPDVSITGPESTLTQPAPFRRIWSSQYQYVARRVGTDRLELGIGFGPSQSKSPLPRSTMYFALDFPDGLQNMTLEVRSTMDKSIPIPSTSVTGSVSEGAYIKIENFEKIAVPAAAAAIVGLAIYFLGPLVPAAIAGLYELLEAVRTALGLGF